MKKTVQAIREHLGFWGSLGLMFLFVLSLGACSANKQSAIEVKDATSKTRFAVSPDGVIFDAGTGLEWVMGPQENPSYSSAANWVANCKVAGGDWRMPTVQELETLYRPGVSTNNMDPAFDPNIWKIYAESGGYSSARAFNFHQGVEMGRQPSEYQEGYKTFGVRSRPR